MTFVAGQVLTAAQLNALDITSLTVDTDTLVVDATNDRVGINTASPSVALDVGGSVVIDDDLTVDTTTLVVDSTNNRVGINTATMDQELHVAGGIKYVTTNGGNGHLAWTNGSNYLTSTDSGSTFFRSYDGSSYTTHVTVSGSDGRVGIGTDSPSYSLDVNNTIRAQSYMRVESGTNEQMSLRANTTSGRPYIALYNYDGSSYVRRGYFGFPTAGSSTATVNLVADNGNLQLVAGNGEVNATPKLSINSGPELSDPGSANELRVTTAHGYIDLGPKNSSYCHIYTDRTRFYFNKGVDSAPYFYWRNNSGIGGPLVDTSSTSGYRYVLQNQFYGTFFDYTSVRDRKDQITNVTAEDSGQWIDALQPVTYIERWMGEGDEPDDARAWREADMQVGFIADDILANTDTDHFSQVLDDGEGGLDPAGWKWECVIAAAVAEIKSLRARVATLEAT